MQSADRAGFSLYYFLQKFFLDIALVYINNGTIFLYRVYNSMKHINETVTLKQTYSSHPVSEKKMFCFADESNMC